MNKIFLLIPLLTLAGCINLSTELQPPNSAVKPMLEGTHCLGIFLGMGGGTNTFTEAMLRTGPIGQSKNVNRGLGTMPASAPIVKIHSAELNDVAFMGFGERCLRVTGEP